MAAVLLPLRPGPASVQWVPADFGGTQKGPLGGSSQRVNRLGNRWRVTITVPPMEPDMARQWSVALVKGLRLGVRWKVRQVGVPVGTPGSPLVAGAAQVGWALDVDNLTPHYGWRQGQFLSVITAAQRYVYQISESGVADAAGVATLPIEPQLRVSPADNDVVEIAQPYIEGLLVDAPTWVYDTDRLARGFDFSIEESR